ncbi:TBC1 domain family member 10B isoform 2 [Schistosoma japonicum]|uniref:TBC1 domain family member 10B isoform 2 n=2 Tax=Schistosoma japonicum TaxID=6182 RepID=A0A4Z2DRB1_SCHJA|nr:TBC1 domain family member 10B isoform 2 [Schistosoma japonicum]
MEEYPEGFDEPVDILIDNNTIDRYGFFGGEQFCSANTKKLSDATLKKIRRKELKWQSMLTEWDKWMSLKADRVRNRCRKGIPPALRSRVWQYLCGSHQMVYLERRKYQVLSRSLGNPETNSQIKLDVSRELSNHVLFASEDGIGRASLFNVLKAYSQLHSDNSYCQAQAPIAAALLIHMPEEDAFWTFVCLCNQYMTDYFKSGLVRVKIELNMLFELVKKYQPNIYYHMIKCNTEPIYFAVDWFMCLYTRNLPWSTVLRIWDMFFFEGVKVLFRIALSIFQLLLGDSESRKRLNSMDKLMESFRNLPKNIIDEDVLINHSLRYNFISKRELAKLYRTQLKSIHLLSSHVS